MSPSSIWPLDKLQAGIETTAGTLVAATRIIQANAELVEQQEPYRSDYPQGVRANVGGLGAIMWKGATLECETDLNAEEVLWPLMTGVRGAVAAVGAGADKTWTFTPQLTTGLVTVDTATIEYMHSDGTTNHYYGEFGHALTSQIGMEWTFNEPAKLNWSMFGRARQTGTATAALVVYPTREILASNSLALYKDTTWAGLGGTQVTGTTRSVTLDITTGMGPDYTLDARADKDFSTYNVGRLMATLEVVQEMNAAGAATFANYRANDAVYIRLKNTGSVVGSGVKTVQVDGAYRFTDSPSFDRDGDVVTVTYNLESFYDATSTKTLEFVVINALTAIA